MAWKCFIVEIDEATGHFKDGGRQWKNEQELPVGAMWVGLESKVWGIKLPGDCGLNRFCPTLEYDGHRWQFNGRPPKVTIRPNIEYVGHYRGSIVDGVISDDLDGRKFTDNGLATL